MAEAMAVHSLAEPEELSAESACRPADRLDPAARAVYPMGPAAGLRGRLMTAEELASPAVPVARFRSPG